MGAARSPVRDSGALRAFAEEITELSDRALAILACYSDDGSISAGFAVAISPAAEKLIDRLGRAAAAVARLSPRESDLARRLRLAKADLAECRSRASSIADRHSRCREQIDAALGVSAEERLADPDGGAGFERLGMPKLAARRRALARERARCDHAAKRLQRALADVNGAVGNVQDAGDLGDAGPCLVADLAACARVLRLQGSFYAHKAGWSEADKAEAGFVAE